ncbi:FtsP/CotA-like multicopper oxidase with cupredoxin domain [Streptomyces griseochromogenes]|uniref:Copper oxidase n=1 Tax=Streptomyces griseochromogenes TaxID=68214 RepID=A0A1B1AX65_9ACTN|nr:multicopper oxidase family protein [Streptomyces griseochromogenes]ANP51178.1 copper oxidase [Streptomyces griseochromogenes]MBP2050149.1 FtsP/CotA-like multicopper oxidase with cupredoxin domain [Streptomyces griseochromogenes]
MHTPSRRTLLRAPIAAVGTALLPACTGSGAQARTGPELRAADGDFVPPGPAGYVDPSGPEVRAAERERGSGPVRMLRFTASETTLDLGGRQVRTWAYQDTLPGPLVRITAGDVLSLTLANRLPTTTTLHSHGVRMRCDMDGAPDLTQRAIAPGADFTYRFTVAHPGTYLFHSHVGLQPDRGLYAPLIVDDPKEPLSYDKEWILVLDDWVDGVDGSTPDRVLHQLKPGGGMSMGGMAMGPERGRPDGPSRVLRNSHSRMLHGEAGSVAYPYYLVNGRTPTHPRVFRCRPGERIRLRIINAGSETAFRVALGGHTMTVTHTDGYPVEHQETDALLVGMAERYDVLVTAGDGVFPFVAQAEGKNGQGLALLRTDNGRSAPPAKVRPDELDGKVIPARRLVPDDSVALDDRDVDREMRIRITGTMARYDWGIDHKLYDVRQRHPVHAGERVRLTLINATDMWHPLHLHGHTFALTGLDAAGARKDTAIVLPHRKIVCEFDADNPGLWMLHCHNQYHSESGMMTILGYRK